ncbi:hypothetical protein ZIOFF_035842 [Zingiber officinale]|uniref:Uncharacterized protein n=1 Tax=Zingiber officinale TaxID=94328 RepID=A0A8J5GHR0_ZINOF|nr:hypothetical protein ZIOFF_035842 [Zingiber officinale]
MKQRDLATGKTTRVANLQSRRLVWESWLSDFKCLQRVASHLIFLHATAGGVQRVNATLIQWLRAHLQSPAAKKITFVTINSKRERRDFTTEEETDAELLDTAMPKEESFMKTSTST